MKLQLCLKRAPLGIVLCCLLLTNAVKTQDHTEVVAVGHALVIDDDTEAAHRWLLAASEAEPDPLWVCDECGVPASDWSLACPACGALDRMAWRQPAARPAALEADPAPGPSENAKAPADNATDRATGVNGPDLPGANGKAPEPV